MPRSGTLRRSVGSLRSMTALAWPLLLVAASAEGASGEAIHLSYQAPAGCPDRQAFEQQLRARFDRLRAAEPQERARLFSAAVTWEAPLFRGVLLVRDLDGQESDREVSASNCDEVISALALVAAAAIELRASRAPVGHRAEAEQRVAAPPAVPVVNQSPPAPPRALRLRAGGHARVATGASPGALWGGTVFLEAARRRAHAWAPLLRLGAGYSPGEPVAVGEVAARFDLLAAHLEVCPVRGAIGSWLELRPCVRVEGGALRASGQLLPDPKAASRPWVAPAVVGRARMEAFGPLAIELEAGAVFPLVRDRFYFGPDLTVHQVPAVAAAAGVGLAVTIW